MSSGGQQPTTKRPRLEDDNGLGNEEEEQPKMKTVLCLCGAMSPITFMHLRMLERARDWLHQSGRYIVKGGLISPVHMAYGKKGLQPNDHRLTMCRLAIKDSDWIRVSDWECSQTGWTTTAVVLKELQQHITQQYGDDVRLRFLCGADLLESFATPGLWDEQDIRDIVQDFGIVVISRYGSNPEKFVYESDILHKLKGNIDIVTEWIPNDVSSTKIRRSLSRGESVRYLVPDAVLEYIKQHQLYQ